MAEFVEFRSEEMIPELEQMERLRLFDKNEIRQIIKKRKGHEYKLQRRTKLKDDYLHYISYEMNLLQLVKVRREKLGVVQKKAEIDYSIANRISNLFKQLIFHFPEDVRIWMSYLKFCKQAKFNSCVSPMLVRMLQVHSDKQNLWKLAAQWEFEMSHSVERARQFLLRGIRYHPDSKVLYTEAFHLELVNAEMIRKQQVEKASEAATGDNKIATPTTGSEVSAVPSTSQSAARDDGGNGRLAEVIYESASKKIADVSFIVQLLAMTKEYSFTQHLQKKIVNDLLSRFPDDELTWDTMARRELEGLSYSADSPTNNEVLPATNQASAANSNESESVNKSTNKNCLRERIHRCCAVYVAAVKHLPTQRMWSLYLDAFLELNQNLVHLPTYKKKLLRSAFQGAHNAGLMQEKYYLQWVDVLKTNNKDKKLDDVLKAATERLPRSVELWQMRLRFYLCKNEEMSGLKVFQNALESLGTADDSTVPLFKILIQFYQTKSIMKVDQVFRDGLQRGSAIAMPLKPIYIEWLVLVKGIVAARKTYDSISQQPPLCLDLHLKMAALECMQPSISVKEVRKCYELACQQFGKNNTDVWMDYIKLEQEKGDPKNISEIYWRALKTLEPMFTDNFVSEFSLVKTGLRDLGTAPP